MPATVYQEPGTDATGNFAFWTSTVNSVSTDTGTKYTGPRSIKVDSGAGNATAYVQKNDILADAGRRIAFRIYLESIPTSAFRCLNLVNAGASPCGGISIDTAGLVRVIAGGTGVSTGVTLSTGQWYHFAFSYTITSPTEAQAKLAINGGAQATSDSSSHNTGTVHMRVGLVQAPGANIVAYFDDIYVDDGSDNSALGDIQVTSKLPATNNTNNFDTAVGNNPANRYENVDDRTLSETDGWQHAAATDVQENYGLEAISAGDEDLTGATLIARTAWLWGKRGGTPAAITPGNTGAEGSAGSGNITLGAPSSPSTNDIWIAAVHSRDNVAHSFTDWTEIAQFNGGGTTSRLSVWYHRYAGVTPNLIVTHTAGDTIVGGIQSFVGVKPSGSPVITQGANSTGTGTTTASGITPGANGCAVVAIFGRGDDDNFDAITDYTVAFEDSAGGTQRNYQSSTGGDGAVGLYYQIQTTATATGDLTATTAATDAWAAIIIALEPLDPSVGSPDLMDNGSETAIVLAETSALYTVTTDSASYPSNAAGIGMRSSGTSVDTYLYECGTLIAYIAGAVVETVVPRKLRRMFRGLGR